MFVLLRVGSDSSAIDDRNGKSEVSSNQSEVSSVNNLDGFNFSSQETCTVFS